MTLPVAFMGRPRCLFFLTRLGRLGGFGWLGFGRHFGGSRFAESFDIDKVLISAGSELGGDEVAAPLDGHRDGLIHGEHTLRCLALRGGEAEGYYGNSGEEP